MAKRSKKKAAELEGGASAAAGPKTGWRWWLSVTWLPAVLAGIAIFFYLPSVGSAFVYDAHVEILQEGFITSLANLPAVLSLKVLGMKLMLGDRPGQLLYLMLIAAISGKNPLGYHVCSILLHGANVALLYVLLRKLIAVDFSAASKTISQRAHLAAAVVTLIFALHPLAVESVSEVSYSSTLLVTLFTLLALLAAMAFRPEDFRAAVKMGALGTLCIFAAVTCKESGLSALLILIAYWFLYRRNEALGTWVCFLAAGTLVTIGFLFARFHFAPADTEAYAYLGGSFAQVLAIQPQLWVFMMGKLFWPVDLSAIYTLSDILVPSTAVSILILVVVVAMQAWLAAKSRIGALGVAFYWLGLVTVSNFVPLFHVVADRYYYLPLAGAAMQLLAVIFLILNATWTYRLVITLCFIALLPLTVLNQFRQVVFGDDLTLWTDTLRVSPHSAYAHIGLGWTLYQAGKIDDAIAEFQKALEIDSGAKRGEYNLALALAQNGKNDDAITHFYKALDQKPHDPETHYDLANTYFQKGDMDLAIAHYEKAVEEKPDYVAAYSNLGNALFQKGKVYESIVAFRKALNIDPDFFNARYNLGIAYAQNLQYSDAIEQFQEALRINPNDETAKKSLARAEAILKGRPPPAK
jgi:tetratricopeptide (TPR) repeat protein